MISPSENEDTYSGFQSFNSNCGFNIPKDTAHHCHLVCMCPCHPSEPCTNHAYTLITVKYSNSILHLIKPQARFDEP